MLYGKLSYAKMQPRIMRARDLIPGEPRARRRGYVWRVASSLRNK
jgi:hypothetical protein